MSSFGGSTYFLTRCHPFGRKFRVKDIFKEQMAPLCSSGCLSGDYAFSIGNVNFYTACSGYLVFFVMVRFHPISTSKYD